MLLRYVECVLQGRAVPQVLLWHRLQIGALSSSCSLVAETTPAPKPLEAPLALPVVGPCPPTAHESLRLPMNLYISGLPPFLPPSQPQPASVRSPAAQGRALCAHRCRGRPHRQECGQPLHSGPGEGRVGVDWSRETEERGGVSVGQLVTLGLCCCCRRRVPMWVRAVTCWWLWEESGGTVGSVEWWGKVPGRAV